MSSFIFSNEDSDDEMEPVPNIVNKFVPTYDIPNQNAIVVNDEKNACVFEQSSNIFGAKSKIHDSNEFVKKDDDFPLLTNTNVKKSTNLGMWAKQGLPHEYADTNVISTISMPPIFAKRKPNVNLSAEKYVEDEESDVESDEDIEINPHIGEPYSKGGW